MKFKRLDIDSAEKFYKPIDNNRITVGTNNVLYWNTGIYGKNMDNSYPDFLIDLAENGTSIHSNILNLKANMITGNNLQPKDADKEGTEELIKFIEKRNKQGTNLKGIYALSAKQFAIFEMAYLQVIYSKDFSKISEVYHVPVKDVRMEKPDKLGNVQAYYVSKRWNDISNKYYKKASIKNSAVRIPAFTGKELAKKLEQPVQLLCIKRPDYNDYYVTPSYAGGLKWILTSNYIVNFHHNNFKNSFLHQGMLVTYGSMDEDEEKQFAADIEELFAGNVTDDKKRLMLANVESKELTPEFISAKDLMQDQFYKDLITEANMQVVSCHNCYGVLAGLEVKGAQLGGDQNMINNAIQAFRLMTTDPLKDYLIAGYNRIMEDNDLPLVDVDTSQFIISNDKNQEKPEEPITSQGQNAQDNIEQTPNI